MEKEVVDGLCTHLGYELIGVGIFKIGIVLWEAVHDFHIFILRQKVQACKRLLGVILHDTRLYHDISLVINDCLKPFGRYAKKVTYLVGQRTEVPYMGNRHYQLDVSATLTTHLLLCYLHATTVADYTLITDTLVFSTMALIILGRSKDTFAKQSVTLWLVCAIVDSLRFQHLTVRVLENLLWRR